jgi:hypothetical protein
MSSQNQVHPQCDCTTHTWNARMHYSGIKETSIGQIGLSVGGREGWFLLTYELSDRQMNWIAEEKPVFVEVFSAHPHKHDLRKIWAVHDVPQDQEGRFRPEQVQQDNIHFLQFETGDDPSKPFPVPLDPNQIEVHYREATLLNRENQPLAIGEATLWPCLLKGEFYPKENLPVKPNTIPQQASILKTSDGRFYRLQPDNLICQSGNKPPHFHFHYCKFEQ